MKKTELLSPAGSVAVMKACISAGADAVYMGLPRFSARAFADNESAESYAEALDYAHLRGVKLYCTVNTLFKENELSEELEPLLRPLYKAGLDAVIVQDLGVMKRVHELFPELPVHVSTQAAVTGYRTASFLKQYHVTRVVPARELSLGEVRELILRSGLEVECFVHGALCYSYSGLCLFSSLAAGRSGNRGRCAQPCRLPYRVLSGTGEGLSSKEEPYVLSMKDLNTIRLLPELVSAGIASLKIEGRMKKAEYAAGVTSVYRKYLDRVLNDPERPYRVEREDEGHLFNLFNRQGFTAGYYHEHSGRDMIALREKEFRKEETVFLEYVRREFIQKEKQVPVRGTYRIEPGTPVSFSLEAESDGKPVTYEVTGRETFVPEAAVSRETTDPEVLKQLGKTGGSDFCFTSLEGKTAGGLFLPVGKLNELRRTALTGLRERLLETKRR